MPSNKNLANAVRVMAAACMTLSLTCANAQTRLADQPIIASRAANANVALALSVEWPTALGDAHKGSTYDSTYTYVGYFDPAKCYTYTSTSKTSPATSYFKPTKKVSNGTCSGDWSGNLLNFATMQTIDIFRWGMTGGSRVVDLPANSSDTQTQLVILRRAYANNQGSIFPTKSVSGAALVKATTPYSTSSVSFVNQNKGVQVVVTRSGYNNETYNVYVEACNPDADSKAGIAALDLVETNCKKYVSPSNSSKVAWKPEGLMQQYKDTFRFAAFGYLNNGDLKLDGGVMRAPMKNIGVELSDMGGFPVNPDSALATASSVSASGAMNYLNNFGYYSNTYKSNDPVSEMYAEVIRYFRGYTSPSPTMIPKTIDATAKDGYPVVTSWSDYPAIQNYCDKNFVVGIGDVNTHADKNISAADKTSNEPTGDMINVGMDAKAWTDKIGTLESMATSSSLGAVTDINGDGTGYDILNQKNTSPGGCCDKNGFLMAGIAYWANTNDVSATFKEQQTVQTYWVDVLENSIYKHRNQFWLAAKYGGFTKGKGVQLSASDAPKTDYSSTVEATRAAANNEWYTQGNVLTSGSTQVSKFMLPNNYYAASDAKKMVESLGKAFSNIKEIASSGSGATAVSPNFATGSAQGIYQTGYDSTDWSGSVTKYTVTGFDSAGLPIIDSDTTKQWNAQTVIDTQFEISNASGTKWSTDRRIVTYSTTTVNGVTTSRGVPFQISSLNATQKATLGLTATEQQSVLEYLRGKQTDQGKTLRARKHFLGDIVDGQPVVVATPSEKYSDDYNPGYTAFKNTTRTAMVYVPANDGMLHALYESSGKEAWAYIPSYLFEGAVVENANIRETDGLAALADSSYAHHYYINATPAVRDVDFSRAGITGWRSVSSNTSTWRTILVGGLGKGGKSYYALDVTAPPDTADTEATIADGTKKKVLWEFTDPDLGFSYGEPVIGKTERWGWVVIISSGHNNTDGHGYIFVLDPRDGRVLAKMAASTSVGTSTDQAGLTQLTGFTRSYSEWIYREVYGADLKGNVWRFELPGSYSDSESETAKDITVVHLATVTDGTRAQSVTVPPWVDIADGKRWVMVATGRALDASDVFAETGVTNPTTQQRQTVYAIRDGNYFQPFRSTSELPTGVTWPIGRNDLIAVTDLTLGTTVTTDKLGWYFDLPHTNAARQTERTISNFYGNSSLIMWTGSVPNGQDVCDPGWSTYTYVVNMATGKSVLTDGSGGLLSSIANDSAMVATSFVRVGNYIRILGTDAKGVTKLIGPVIGGGTKPTFVNWRSLDQ
ncbi:MAG: PilC/PilY family type IV pilus protein [Rhodocyclaceae bacterium]